MTNHEEFEVGHEMDRAVRAAVTGLAQLAERLARRGQDNARASAARDREEWLAQRDAARQQYLPLMQPGRVERFHPVVASQRWAVAAAWSDMDPTARAAERELAGRIQQAHGIHPSEVLKRPAPSGPPPREPAVRPVSMNEAYGLATLHAPPWWVIPTGVEPLEQDRGPSNAIEQAFHADWQHFSETGDLPERSQREQWASRAGRGSEFEPSLWLTAEGVVDHAARDAALAQVWNEGSVERTGSALAGHEQALNRAGMRSLSDVFAEPSRFSPGPFLAEPSSQDDQDRWAQWGVPSRQVGEVDSARWVIPAGQAAGQPAGVAEPESWHAYLTPSEFDAASPDALVAAWRDASANALTGDVEAQRAASEISSMMRERRGLNPESLLIAALTEQAAQTTESRRSAEDRVQSAVESQGHPVAFVADPQQDQSVVSRERVLELNDQASSYYAAQLRPGSRAHQYLTDRLGPDWETGPWQLGYAGNGWQNLTKHLREQGATDAEMVAAGLAEHGKFGVRDVFRDRVIMGIRDPESGATVGFLGRDLSGDPRAPKVRNTAETPAFRKGDHVFGLYEAGQGVPLVRVEGPFDAMATSLASGRTVAGVAPMGTQMTDRQATAIASRANGRVWLANDTDSAGRKASAEDFFKFSAKGADVRQIDVPGSDPAEAWRERPTLMRDALSNLAGNRSAAETVVDSFLADPEATKAGFAALMTDLEPYVEPLDRRLLEARGADLGLARDRRQVAEAEEASATAATGSSTGTAVPRGDVEDPDRFALVTRAGEEREVAEDVAEEAKGDELVAYDRRDEAQAELSDQQSAARDASSHGFSQSTQDQVKNARKRTIGTPAKVRRGTGVKHISGRTLQR